MKMICSKTDGGQQMNCKQSAKKHLHARDIFSPEHGTTPVFLVRLVNIKIPEEYN